MYSASRNALIVLLACCAVDCAPSSAQGQRDAQRIIKVCADPNNLPFSNQALAGFENKIAALVADRLGARVEYEWWAQRRGFIRNTLRAGTCDVVIGLPTKMEMAATTRPYYRSSYVFVSRKGAHQPSSQAGASLLGEDRNPPDVRVLLQPVAQQQPACGQRRLTAQQQCVHGAPSPCRRLVMLVDLEVLGHALFLDEDGAADGQGQGHVGL